MLVNQLNSIIIIIIMMALSHLCWVQVQLLEFCFAIPIWGDKQVDLGKNRSGSLRVSIGWSPKWVGQFQPALDVGQSHSNCITHINERKSKKEEGRGKSNWSHERSCANGGELPAVEKMRSFVENTLSIFINMNTALLGSCPLLVKENGVWILRGSHLCYVWDKWNYKVGPTKIRILTVQNDPLFYEMWPNFTLLAVGSTIRSSK